jgi:hypothetical protein
MNTADYQDEYPILRRNCNRVARHKVGIYNIRRLCVDLPDIAKSIAAWCIASEQATDGDSIPDYDKLHQIALSSAKPEETILKLEKASPLFEEHLNTVSVSVYDETANTPTVLEPVDVTEIELPAVSYIKRATAKAAEKIGHKH